jgi:hypothetical protein
MPGFFIDHAIFKTGFLVSPCDSSKKERTIIETTREQFIYCNQSWRDLFGSNSPIIKF